jgi:hypothetical protein
VEVKGSRARDIALLFSHLLWSILPDWKYHFHAADDIWQLRTL